MFQKLFLLFLAVFLYIDVPAQPGSGIQVTVTIDTVTDKPDGIAYRRGYRLDLDDFEGRPERGSDAVAMAYSGMDIRYNGQSKGGLTRIDIHLTAVFDRSRSWCLPSSRNAWTLQHEQLHFDITALNTCLLRDALQRYPYTRNFAKEIASLQQEYQQRTADMQDDYDNSTRHGINREEQERWSRELPRMMAQAASCY